ncbi:hypothetical protein B0T25DRAFT_124238 [Lasiosphaeria hispida]|uniref:Secreted protein n=1 Tax=Lasiosphaeria hispida TaxID=260671 RepID=A0AAJ0HS19_9PEZI|nr:hypothetical protein B0T25DRAFT_124238 [Lasiosphaeria hispida]
MQSHMCVCVPGLMLVGTLPLSSLGGTGRKHNGCGKKGLALIPRNECCWLYQSEHKCLTLQPFDRMARKGGRLGKGKMPGATLPTCSPGCLYRSAHQKYEDGPTHQQCTVTQFNFGV